MSACSRLIPSFASRVRFPFSSFSRFPFPPSFLAFSFFFWLPLEPSARAFSFFLLYFFHLIPSFSLCSQFSSWRWLPVDGVVDEGKKRRKKQDNEKKIRFERILNFTLDYPHETHTHTRAHTETRARAHLQPCVFLPR